MQSEFGIEVPKGSPGGIEAGAHALRSMQGGLEHVSSILSGSGQIGGWTGMASLSYAGRAARYAQAASYAANAMSLASATLMELSQLLEDAQKQARQAIEDARDAHRRMERARDLIAQAQQAAAQARQQIADAEHRMAVSAAHGHPNPGAAGDAAVGAASLGAAELDEAAARQMLSQAEQDFHDAQQRGKRINHRWDEEAQRGAAMLRNVAQAGSAVGTPTGTPSPALIGLGIPVLFGGSPFVSGPAAPLGGRSEGGSPFLPSPFALPGLGMSATEGAHAGAAGIASWGGRNLPTLRSSAASAALRDGGSAAKSLAPLAHAARFAGPAADVAANVLEGRSAGETAVHTTLSAGGAAIGASIVGGGCEVGTLGVGTPACVAGGAAAGAAGAWLGDQAANVADDLGISGAVDDGIDAIGGLFD